ncbi:SRPBCC family protein [Mesorhizobium sp. LHD-90]|uniref:SRPBCC family protein n=1 Tax=Mesorhizobium sp. LHD-90 TaxID=3071414 RepID=UPI0027DF598E|nr:SRPBCC family protein [Mesorhizobium sp. LHD-90]MDQ6437317.1 SRPBCC family protein [Mesorhizobium sp. LHD-90]
MSKHSVEHASFIIERHYDFSPTVVFKAFSDPAHKRKWFVDGEGWTTDSYESDFRVGGFERSRFRFGDGPPMGNDTVYLDIVPDRRIVFAYSMLMGDTPFSASLATIEFLPDGNGTKLTYTEQAAFLDGKDQVKDREEGCRGLFEMLATYLDSAAKQA